MLIKIKKHLTYHLKALKNSLNSLWEKPLANVMTIIVIGITLTLPAVFFVLADNLQQVNVDWQRGGHISLYLDASSSANEAALLKKVRNTEGVAEATLKTAAEGLALLQQQDGMHDIMQYLPENPLPAVIDVVPALDRDNALKLEQLYQTLKAYPQVEQAKIDMQWVKKLYSMLDVVSKLARALMLLLASAVVLIIGNTLRLAIQTRQEEIVVLKLIGANDSFITRPFLYLGMCYGFGGALLALLFVNGIILSLTLLVNQLAASYEIHYTVMALSIGQMMLLAIFSTFLGWLGARLSVRSLCKMQWN
jgi:cell division transport system permease protein